MMLKFTNPYTGKPMYLNSSIKNRIKSVYSEGGYTIIGFPNSSAGVTETVEQVLVKFGLEPVIFTCAHSKQCVIIYKNIKNNIRAVIEWPDGTLVSTKYEALLVTESQEEVMEKLGLDYEKL